MTEATEQQNEVTSTWSRTWQVLGMLIAVATCISIVKNVGSIELYGTPAKMLAQYTWLRDMLFEPVAWALRYLGVNLAWWFKDLFLVYSLIGAAYVRAETVQYAEVIKYRPLAFLGWPRRLAFESWIAANREDFYERGVFSRADKPKRSFLSRFAVQLIVVIVAAAAFFAWNSLSSGAGPG